MERTLAAVLVKCDELISRGKRMLRLLEARELGQEGFLQEAAFYLFMKGEKDLARLRMGSEECSRH